MSEFATVSLIIFCIYISMKVFLLFYIRYKNWYLASSQNALEFTQNLRQLLKSFKIPEKSSSTIGFTCEAIPCTG